MPVKVRCRGCQKVLNAPDKARGKTVACPDCGEKIKIPAGDGGDAPAAPAGVKPAKQAPGKQAPIKKATKPPAPGDSAEFLSGLNVDQLESEHGEEKVCPYCAADLPDDGEVFDPVCRKCGMNTATGQMDVKEAKKRARKGADPALFYSVAWTDSWAFLQQYWRLGMKTGYTWTGFLTIVLTCIFMMKTWVFVESTEPAAAPVPVAEGEVPEGPKSPWQSPGFFFYTGLATVFALGIPGWFWALALKIIDATMSKEQLKEDRISADPFEAIALGFRVIFWPIILMLPLLPVYAGAAYLMGAAPLLSGGTVTWSTGLTALVVSYFVVPYLFFPQALIHMTVRHRFKAWILWDQVLVFLKNARATLYWWVVATVVFSPLIVIAVLVGLNAESVLNWTFEKLDSLAAWIFGFIMDVGDPGQRGLFFAILFSAFLPVALGVVAAALSFLGAFSAVFLMRATGNYGFYNREHLMLVTNVSDNQPAGFWVRFLCRAIDYGVVLVFWAIMMGLPYLLVVSEFPLGRYFGGGIMAAVNVGFAAIVGSQNAKASMISIGLGVLAGVTFIYMASIEAFILVFNILFYAVPLYNAGMLFVVNEATTQRSTIGKEAFGLIVQGAEKQKELTPQQAFVRHLGRVLSDVLLGLPYIMSAFNPKKQALHDVMAKAEVVFRGDK